jgi:valyl-tRNA synthetase
VPFPVWYQVDANGNIDYSKVILPTADQLPIDPMADTPTDYREEMRNQPNGFAGDPDVMDTWATSALTPQIAMAQAENAPNLSLPFDIRPQAHDIIRTWAFYTIAKSLMHENTIPWYKTLISGFILDPDRKKMSKSKGNVVTPMHLIENHSADAVRYWAAKAKLGADTAFEEKMMQQGRKLVVKIYNASKFVFMIVGNSTSADYTKDITSSMDKSWIAKLSDTVKAAKQSFENYDYSLALDAIETRFWDFCDNYVEIVKKRAYSEDNGSAIATLKLSLDTFVKLLAPFCPFITEEVYQARPWKKTTDISVHKELWTSLDGLDKLATDSLLYNTVSAVSTEIRKQKTLENKSQKNPVLNLTIKANEQTLTCLKGNDSDLLNVGNIVSGGIDYQQAEDLSIENITLDNNFVPEKKK